MPNSTVSCCYTPKLQGLNDRFCTQQSFNCLCKCQSAFKLCFSFSMVHDAISEKGWFYFLKVQKIVIRKMMTYLHLCYISRKDKYFIEIYRSCNLEVTILRRRNTLHFSNQKLKVLLKLLTLNSSSRQRNPSSGFQNGKYFIA